MAVEAMEIGLVQWAHGTPESFLSDLQAFGLRVCQLGVPPELACPTSAPAWRDGLASADVFVSGAVCSYAGEDYADLQRVHRTVGFTAPGYAAERIARTMEVSAWAATLGLTALSCHIGFIPAVTESPVYTGLLAIAREIADACAANGQSFALETGQESAATLLQFLADVDRPNLKVNFDPANMIIYGSGDPLQALETLAPHVLSIHCKDGRSPGAAGGLGHEVALGDGEVDFPGFLKLLEHLNYRGQLTIEREEPDPTRRAADVAQAITRLKIWKQALA